MDLLDVNTKALAQLGAEAFSQRKHLKGILEETQADFQWTKVMTFIATIHLPANLLAVSKSCPSLAILIKLIFNVSRQSSLQALFIFPLVKRTVKLWCFQSGTRWGFILLCLFS